jgi:hypothetical protein
MAAVNRIDVFVKTGSIAFGGTNGTVYAGIGGREFVLDSSGNDFQTFATFTYIIGTGSNLAVVLGGSLTQRIDTEDVIALPRYIRFEPKRDIDKWELTVVTMTVNPGTQQILFAYPFADRKVTLGVDTGKYVFLKQA